MPDDVWKQFGNNLPIRVIFFSSLAKEGLSFYYAGSGVLIVVVNIRKIQLS